MLLMESAEGYVQPSPLSFDRAAQALKLLAQFHAAAWGDAEALKLIANTIASSGGNSHWALRSWHEKRATAENHQGTTEQMRPSECGHTTRPPFTHTTHTHTRRSHTTFTHHVHTFVSRFSMLA